MEKKVSEVYLNIDDKTNIITWAAGAETTDDEKQKFAQLALKYAKEKNIKPVDSQVATNTTVVFGNLKLGYYLIDTTLGALCTLDTTNKVINVREKNIVPSNSKQVKEDAQPDNWQETTVTRNADQTATTKYGTNDDDIGSVVQFRSFILVGKGTDKLLFHDVMSAGLTLLPETVTVKAKKESDDNYTTFNAKQDTKTTNFIITTGNAIGTDKCKNHDEVCDLHVEFKEGILNRIKNGTADKYQIVIEYKAVINENAVIGSVGNPNVSFLEYGNNGNFTPDSKTITKTWGFDVLKFELNGSTREGLKDAKFSLHKQATSGIAADPVEDTSNLGETIKLVLKSSATGTPGTADYKPVVYRVARMKVNSDGSVAKDESDNVIYDEGSNELLDQITTDASGRFRIEGLDSSTYLLNEDDSPNGYKKLAKPVQVIIDYNVSGSDQDCTIKQGSNTVDLIAVQNGTGSELPATGGIGTTIFYISGSILLIGAAVLLIVKKRMSNEK